MVDTLKHLFLPHHTNNYRAKVLHVDFFLVYVALFFIVSLAFKTIHRVEPSILGFATNIHVDQLLSLTNQKRSEVGAGSVQLNAKLSQAAAEKAKHMFEHNYWAHTAPSGTTPWDFINNAGYVYTVAGENLAKNFSDSSGVVEAWMNSPTHKENLLRVQYQDVGFAVVNGVLNGEETTLVVQMFGTQLAVAPPPEETAEAVPALGVPEPEVAQAEDTLVPQVQTEPLAQALPTPESVIAPVEVTPYAASVVKNPLFDIPTLSKQLSLALATLLMIALVVDGIYIWHRKIYRVSGRSVAHLFFLFTITGAIWYMSFGSIL